MTPATMRDCAAYFDQLAAEYAGHGDAQEADHWAAQAKAIRHKLARDEALVKLERALDCPRSDQQCSYYLCRAADLLKMAGLPELAADVIEAAENFCDIGSVESVRDQLERTTQ